MSGKKIYGLESLIPRPDFKVSGTRQGGATASQSYLILKDDFQQAVQNGVFKAGVTASSIDPNTQSRGGDALYLDRIETADQREGWLLVSAFFGGWSASYQEGERDEQPTYAKRGVLVQRSVLEHPTVRAMSDVDRFLCSYTLEGGFMWDSSDSKLKIRTVDGDGNEKLVETGTQPSTDDAKEWCKKITNGEHTYEAAHITWTKTWNDAAGVPDATANNLGKIDTPSGSPYTPVDRDWRLDEVSETRQGNLYQNRTFHTLSEPGKWDADTYDY